MVRQALITLLFGFIFSAVIGFFVPSAFAATVELSGKVIDSTNSPISSTIIVKDTKTQAVVANLPTDPFGNYVVPVTPGTYLLTVIPQAGSGISQTTKTVTVTDNTVENIALPTASKLPGTDKSKNELSSVSSTILFEIFAVLIVVVGYVLWKQKLIRFTK